MTDLGLLKLSGIVFCMLSTKEAHNDNVFQRTEEQAHCLR